jgi:hypothetical protein
MRLAKAAPFRPIPVVVSKNMCTKCKLSDFHGSAFEPTNLLSRNRSIGLLRQHTIGDQGHKLSIGYISDSATGAHAMPNTGSHNCCAEIVFGYSRWYNLLMIATCLKTTTRTTSSQK